MEVQLRKQLHNLTISGRALLVFTIWSLCKGFLVVFLDAPALAESSGDLTDSYDQLEAAAAKNPIFALIFLLLILLVLILYVGINIYIGKTAVAVGQRKKEGRIFYLVLTAILLSANLATDLIQVITYHYADLSLASLAAVILEATSLYLLFEVLRSSLLIRRLQKAGISADD